MSNNNINDNDNSNSSSSPFPLLPPLFDESCFPQETFSMITSSFFKNIDILADNNAPFETRIFIVGYLVMFGIIILILRQAATADSRSEMIRKLMRTKGFINDNTGDVVLQPLSTITYNLFTLILRISFFIILLFPATPSPSFFMRDFFFPNSYACLTLPASACIYQPQWTGVYYACLSEKLTRETWNADPYERNYTRTSQCMNTRITAGQSPQSSCDVSGRQFYLPSDYYIENSFFVDVENLTQQCFNATGGAANNAPNCTVYNLLNPDIVGAIILTTNHERPMFGVGLVIGLIGLILQVLAEVYWVKRNPDDLRKMRTISTTYLNYCDFVDHMRNPKTTVYKEFDWKFIGVGFLLQGCSFFAPMMYLFSSYTNSVLMMYYPVIVLTATATWDLLWLLFVLFARRSDQPENVPFTDFDAQLKMLAVKSKNGEKTNSTSDAAYTPPAADIVDNNVHQQDEQEKSSETENLTSNDLQTPKTLEDLLPTTRPRSWKQTHEAILVLTIACLWNFTLIRWVALDFITPILIFLISLPVYIIALFWRTRNSLSLIANDDGTLTCYLDKITGAGISVSIDITNPFLRRGGCRIEVIQPTNNPQFYFDNKIDPSDFLAARLWVDHLDYLLLFDETEKEEAIQQRMEWLTTIIQNSHRDLFTNENTTEIPRKQTADSHLSHLVTFAGRACQSEDLLNLALRLDPNNRLAYASLMTMQSNNNNHDEDDEHENDNEKKEKEEEQKEAKEEEKQEKKKAKIFNNDDPNSLSFDKKWGDVLRINLRASIWFLCLLQATAPFVIFGLFDMVRLQNGQGAPVCIDRKTFFPLDAQPYQVRFIDYEIGNGNPIILSVFPQMVYIEIFVFLMLFIVHVDIATRKKIALDPVLMLRLQAAGGVLAAIVWPASISAVASIPLNYLDYMFGENYANGNPGDGPAFTIGLLTVKSVESLCMLVAPFMGIVFPLIP